MTNEVAFATMRIGTFRYDDAIARFDPAIRRRPESRLYRCRRCVHSPLTIDQHLLLVYVVRTTYTRARTHARTYTLARAHIIIDISRQADGYSDYTRLTYRKRLSVGAAKFAAHVRIIAVRVAVRVRVGTVNSIAAIPKLSAVPTTILFYYSNKTRIVTSDGHLIIHFIAYPPPTTVVCRARTSFVHSVCASLPQPLSVIIIVNLHYIVGTPHNIVNNSHRYH